jgi:hypothetical protein
VNVFEGKLKRVLFLGTFIDGQVEVQQQTFRVFLNVYDPLIAGQRVFLQVPADRCQITR